MTTLSRSFVLVAGVLLSLCASGCMSYKQSFAGHDPQTVFTAMRAVAEQPEYTDWKVMENDVWVDEAGHRIEVLRRLERTRYEPVSDPRHETQKWNVTIKLDKDEPPTASYTIRNSTIPAHARREAERYFVDVWEVLGGAPLPNAPHEPVVTNEGLTTNDN